MWKSSARRLAAWKAAWSITLRLCEHGWSTTYKAKGCSNFRFVEPNCGTWTADSHQVSDLIPPQPAEVEHVIGASILDLRGTFFIASY